jgi:BirA family biotin operon repressor/biotin-[acetyl-CoA-carboxylase] ligase
MQAPNHTLIKLIDLLSDQHTHDGTSIGQALNITRAAVWKAVKKLVAYGVPIESTQGKGYCLTEPFSLLNPTKIYSQFKKKEFVLEVLLKTPSTNTHLKKNNAPVSKPMFCVAEMQLQGKGRFERRWHSPFGQNIYLSLKYRFKKEISELSGLSLVVGLALIKAIGGVCDVGEALSIKWPNDILLNHQKIAGTLIEINAESCGDCTAIIGMGVNVNIQEATKREIGQAWTSLRAHTGRYQERNVLCAEIMKQVLIYLERFQRVGLNDFVDEWRRYDCLYQQAVGVMINEQSIHGRGAGINAQGHLLLELPSGKQQAFASGESSVLKK